MLLIDALYINNGGGKTLLDYLIAKVISKNIKVIYLLDERISEEYRAKNLENVTYLKASLVKRHFFYLKHKSLISSVLAFGNIPPTVTLNCPTYTYFHNVLLIENRIPKGLALGILFIKSLVIQLFKKNTHKWIVQSGYIKTKLSQSWNIKEQNILVMPIFDDLKMGLSPRNRKIGTVNSDTIKFLYVSEGYLYKNHSRLIKAFSKYNLSYPKSSLTLTISDSCVSLKHEIKKLINEGVNIIDTGIVSRELLNKEYQKADILFYPSLYESFGLGLIEAAMCNLSISASNLPYVYEVISPSSVFDPLSIESIYEQMIKAGELMQRPSKIVCINCVGKLISEISKNNV